MMTSRIDDMGAVPLEDEAHPSSLGAVLNSQDCVKRGFGAGSWKSESRESDGKEDVRRARWFSAVVGLREGGLVATTAARHRGGVPSPGSRHGIL